MREIPADEVAPGRPKADVLALGLLDGLCEQDRALTSGEPHPSSATHDPA
jgi:hypothetical protein